jgi:hypothetical protein
MKKNLIVIALLAAVTFMFVGCTEANASFDAEGYLASASAYSDARPSTFNASDCEATISNGIITVNGTAAYKNLFTIKFPGGNIPFGASNVVIEYVCVKDSGTMSLTTKQGFDGPGFVPNVGDLNLAAGAYNYSFSDGLNQLKIPTSAFSTYRDGVSFENNNSAQAWRIKILNVLFE